MTEILTENAAAIDFSKAWNTLNPDKFIALLAPDASYESQWVFEELVGASAIAEYLNNKMKTLRCDAVCHAVIHPEVYKECGASS